MEIILKKIIDDFRNCDKIDNCEQCKAHTKMEYLDEELETSYCVFLREFGRRAIDDINEIMEKVL